MLRSDLPSWVRNTLAPAGCSFAIVFIVAATPAFAAVGGPDAFGYHWIDSLETGGPKYVALDLSATGALVVTGDDSSSLSAPPGGIGAPVQLAVPFNFYGSSITALNMCANGYLSTAAAEAGGDVSNDCPLPIVPSSGSGGRIYPLHDDLILDTAVGAGGFYRYFASCPRGSDRGGPLGCHVFQWRRAAHWPGGGPTFDLWAILYDSGDIVLQAGAGNPETGSDSTTGIQNAAATIGLTVHCNAAGSVPSNYAVSLLHPSAPKLRILNLHDTATPNYMVQAAAAMDASLTVVSTRTEFDNAFDGGVWDVIVYNSWNLGSPLAPELDRMNAHALAGKRVLLNSWDLSVALAHPLLTSTCPATVASSYSAPVPVYSWIPGHSIFQLPRLVAPNPIGTSGTDSFLTDGHNGQPQAGSFAVAGYGAVPAANTAAIIVSCDSSVVLNLFTPQTLAPGPTIDLLIDEILMGKRGGILVWDDTPRSTTIRHEQTFADAAQLLGYAPTLATNQGNFTAWLNAACWELVIGDVGGSGLSTPTLDQLRNYLNAGNPVIFGHWDAPGDSGHALFAQEGITLGSSFGAGDSVYEWDPSSPVFRSPRSVPTLGPTNPAVTYGTYAHNHTTAPNRTVGGFNPLPGARGGISIGASDRFLYNSFMLDEYAAQDGDADGVADSQELAINEIVRLLGGCPTLCGDCNGNGLGPDILDSLEAARIAAGIVVPSPQQLSCCDVNTSASISVLDALGIAQIAAGLPVVLTCP